MPTIQNKRGLAAVLSAVNPVPAAGEVIYETDTLKWKIGDGTTAWNSLAYGAPVSAASVTGLAAVATSGSYSDLTGAPSQAVTLTGNVTGTGTGTIATTIPAGVVTNTMQADMTANRIKGRITAGAGRPEDLTNTMVKTILAITTADVSGLGTMATQAAADYLPIAGGTLTGGLSLSYDSPLLQFANSGLSQNWRIGCSGSTSFFVQDQTNNKIPFLIAANAPQDSISVSSSGLVSIASGQINFPATANLSANANTLDDYEEGTWTPTFIGSTTSPTVNYSASTYGHYTKIGKVVVLQGRIILTAASGGSGELRIAGLPFGPSSGAVQQAVSVGTRVNFTTQAPNQCYLHATVSQLRLAFFTATGATFNTPANLAANSDITFGGVYMTDA